ncbi:hypothetical protein L2E82_28553 [Cichorium intybus]|uniref:Uncharacterized protein n=1 Tax=Cichorium intybus TaxID=13427 RepID=A0ACB9CW18_CICIN|nr:hypothetical protein L2E82_28553 [Cichorium intybus]
MESCVDLSFVKVNDQKQGFQPVFVGSGNDKGGVNQKESSTESAKAKKKLAAIKNGVKVAPAKKAAPAAATKSAGEVVEVRFAMRDDRFAGYGHVEFATCDAAQEALKLHEELLLDRPMKLDLAKERGAFTPANGGNERSFQKSGGQAQIVEFFLSQIVQFQSSEYYIHSNPSTVKRCILLMPLVEARIQQQLCASQYQTNDETNHDLFCIEDTVVRNPLTRQKPLLSLPFPKRMATTTSRISGKVALITGAASGIGECTAKLFAEHGAKVVIADIQDELGRAVCEAIGSSKSIYVHCDVTNEEDVKNAVDTAVATYGKLDIMFCNAGIVDPNKPGILMTEKVDFDQVLSVNITGVFLGMKHATRVMVPKQSGSIISMASLASNVGGVASHAYCCAKHAVVGLTKNLAVELGQFGIRVNCLSPYAMVTPLATSFVGLEEEALENYMNERANLKGVTLKTDDVAQAALFLVSDEAKYISGQNLFIDGGFGITNPSLNSLKYPKNL